MQTNNPRSRLVDAKFTKGGWTHNVLFRQKGPFEAPEFTTFVTICTFLLRWMMSNTSKLGAAMLAKLEPQPERIKSLSPLRRQTNKMPNRQYVAVTESRRDICST